jgi:hypothetical protein
MMWLHGQPTKDGFYWYRRGTGKGDEELAGEDTQIVKVDGHRVSIAGSARTVDSELLAGQWVGPLAPPEEDEPRVESP